MNEILKQSIFSWIIISLKYFKFNLNEFEESNEK